VLEEGIGSDWFEQATGWFVAARQPDLIQSVSHAVTCRILLYQPSSVSCCSIRRYSVYFPQLLLILQITSPQASHTCASRSSPSWGTASPATTLAPSLNLSTS
jgi:hypothetical protein